MLPDISKAAFDIYDEQDKLRLAEKLLRDEQLDYERRVKLACRLPSYFRKYYLRCHSYQINPLLFIVFYFVKLILCWLSYGWLTFRKLIGVPRDYIDLRTLIFLERPIHTAIASLNPGGEVYIPAGTNEISEIINVVDNLKLIGAGRSSVIKMANGANLNAMVKISDKDYVTIEGLYFTNNIDNQTSGDNAIILIEKSSQYVKIKDCVFNGGSRSSSVSGHAIHITDGDNIEISGCFSNNWTNHSLIVTSNCDSVTIHGCMFSSLEVKAIEITDKSHNVVVDRNTFINIGNATDGIGHAVLVTAAEDDKITSYPNKIVISNNICYRNYGDQIRVEYAYMVNIIGNIVFGNFNEDNFPQETSNSANNGLSGISCSAELSSISNNISCFNGKHGIELFNNGRYGDSFFRVVSSNVCMNNGKSTSLANQSGICINDVKHVVIIGNFCGDNQVSTSQDYGVLIHGDSKYNLVVGNMFINNISGHISLGSDYDLNVVAFNHEGDMNYNGDVPRISPFRVYSYSTGDNYAYFSGDCKSTVPLSTEPGLAIGCNYSGTYKESVIVFNSSSSSGADFYIKEYNGSSMSNRVRVLKGGEVEIYGNIRLYSQLSHGGTTLGFYGVTPIARQTLPTGAGRTVDDVITALQNLGLVKQS